MSANLERWNVYRNYVQHEDDLTHQRLNWMLILQGFLFSAYASTYSGLLSAGSAVTSPKASDLFQKLFPHILATLQSLSATIPVLGYMVAVFSLSGVKAARTSVKRLEKLWEAEPASAHFPPLLGAGQPDVESLDSWLPFGMPLSICICWLYLGVRQALANGWLTSICSVVLCCAVACLLILEPLLKQLQHLINRQWKKLKKYLNKEPRRKRRGI